MKLRSALLAAAFAARANAFSELFTNPAQQYVLSVPDQSPTFFYTPTTYGNGTGSWNVSYSDSPWSNYTPGNDNPGQGRSVHWTNASQATIYFQFVGTGFTAYGTLTGGSSLVVALDNENVLPQPGNATATTPPILTSASGLDYAFHQVTFTRLGTGGIEFYGVDFDLASGAVGSTYTNITLPAAENGTLQSDESFLWSSQWNILTEDDGTYVASTSTQNSSFEFLPPSNTSILIIYGNTGPNSGQFEVALQSDAFSVSDLSNVTGFSQDFYGLPVTPWQTSDQILFFQSLVPYYAYSVIVEIVGASSNNGKDPYLNVSRIVYISSSSDGASNVTTALGPLPTDSDGDIPPLDGPNYDVKARIAGGVVGGVLLVALVVLGVWFYRRRKRRMGQRDSEGEEDSKGIELETPFEVDAHRERTPRHPPEIVPFEGTANPTMPPPTEKQRLSAIAPSPEAGPSGTRYPASPAIASIAEETGVATQGPSSPMGNSFDGLDPRDPAYRAKWEILHSLERESPTDRRAASPVSPSATTFTREVDAGRYDGDSVVLPPDYNPAWAQRPPGGSGAQ